MIFEWPNCPIIEASDLKEAKMKGGRFLLFDIRNGANALSHYNTEHLEDAVFVDVTKDLCKPFTNAAFGGRHPLPSLNDFAKTLGRLGVEADTKMVLYDTHFGANAAARFWWMLNATGHRNVWVLNGGIAAATKADYPMSRTLAAAKPVALRTIKEWNWPTVTLETVNEIKENNKYLVLDVRMEDRYNGLVEPIDLIAGHIPGAINLSYLQNIDGQGKFKPAQILREEYSTLFGQIPSQNITVHCGSGVTACHTVLAMAYAGLEIPNLYVGSWSEWSRREMPIKIEAHKKLSKAELEQLVSCAIKEENISIEGELVVTKRKAIWDNVVSTVKKVGSVAKREKKETIIAAHILKRYLLKQEISKEELEFLKSQSIDIARILPIVAVQAVPAPIPMTPFLIALGKKMGIDLIPKAQQVPKSFEDREKQAKKV